MFMESETNIWKYARNKVQTVTKQRSKITHYVLFPSGYVEMGSYHDLP